MTSKTKEEEFQEQVDKMITETLAKFPKQKEDSCNVCKEIMDRKVKEAKAEGYSKYQKNIKTARQCLQFILRNKKNCTNIDCTNSACPLQKRWMTK